MVDCRWLFSSFDDVVLLFCCLAIVAEVSWGCSRSSSSRSRSRSSCCCCGTGAGAGGGGGGGGARVEYRNQACAQRTADDGHLLG